MDIQTEPNRVPGLRASGSLQPSPQAVPPRHLLLVEDNVADVRLFERRMHERDEAVRISVASDGASALEMLDQVIEGTVASPDLLVLDLNLPVLKGWAILRYVKRSPLLRFIPVVVLSNSKAGPDIDRAYREGASSYLHKGRDLDGFLRTVDAIHDYWCGVGDVPKDSGTDH